MLDKREENSIFWGQRDLGEQMEDPTHSQTVIGEKRSIPAQHQWSEAVKEGDLKHLLAVVAFCFHGLIHSSAQK